MRILFHIPHSPFARRVRLALAHKGLTAELRDVRAFPEYREEARRLSPLKTVPVLVEEDGQALGDSMAISHYLDRAYPSGPALWPADPADALALFEVASLVEVAINHAVDFGVRNHPLHTAEAWPTVKGEAMDRAQRALDGLGRRVASLSRPTIARSGWCAADIWLFTMEHWFSTMPQRVASFAPAAQVVALGLRLPPEISRWADQHRDRPDVLALDER